MEGDLKIIWKDFRNEGNAEGEDNLQAVSALSYELTIPSSKIEKSIYGQHDSFFPRQGTPLPGHGLLQPRRS